MKDNNLFKTKFFWKIFCIPSIILVAISFFSNILPIMLKWRTLDSIIWKEIIILDIIYLIILLIFSVIASYIYNVIEKENNFLLKHIRITSIIGISAFFIGAFTSYNSFEYSVKRVIIVFLFSFIPLIINIVLLLAMLIFRKRVRSTIVFTTIIVVLVCVSVWYHFFTILFVGLDEAMTPVTNPKYYSNYVHSKNLKKVFPERIPENVDDVKFYYLAGTFQGGTHLSLYYVDKNMTIDMFDERYRENAKFIGHRYEWSEVNGGLLSGAFMFTPAEGKNEDDYTIYLIEGSCHKENDCNHGDYIMAAYNEQTNEVLFKQEIW